MISITPMTAMMSTVCLQPNMVMRLEHMGLKMAPMTPDEDMVSPMTKPFLILNQLLRVAGMTTMLQLMPMPQMTAAMYHCQRLLKKAMAAKEPT